MHSRYVQKHHLALVALVVVVTLIASFFSETPSVSAAGSQQFTSSGTFTVPAYGTLTATCWGGGGGGGGANAGSTGGQSSFNGQIFANGGTGGGGGISSAAYAGGAGGTASGGTTNTTGNNGATGGASAGGAGGAGANGGAGGAGSSSGNGTGGSVPGGGGGGAIQPLTRGSVARGGGGGGGGYTTKTYTAGQLTQGAGISVVVGGGGAGNSLSGYAFHGGAGAAGRCDISWTDPVAPGTPGTPTFSNVTASGMRVSWTAASNATSYNVERCAGSGCSNYASVATGVTSLFFDDSGLSGSTLYRYRVVASNSGTLGSYSGTGEQTTALAVPSAPGTPTFSSVLSTSMQVNWTAASGASTYAVERCSGAGCSSFAGISGASALAGTSWSDTGLTAATSYSYRVKATNAAGTGSYSGTGTQVTNATPPTCSLSANPTSIMPGHSSTLSWSSTDATGGTIDSGVGSVNTSGSVSVSPSVTTTYTGTFTGAGGSIQCQATVTATVCGSGGSGGNVHGFAWSENVGWISFNSADSGTCTPISYGMDIDADGIFSGYAWSENIGWISAEPTDLSGCPSSPCTARMDGSVLKGWMKAIAADGNGWDGWISLSGTSPAYGPTLNGNTYSGYVWGSDVVGWIDFAPTVGGVEIADPVSTEFEACEATYQCVDATHWDNVCTPSINENTQCGAGLICASGGVACVLPGGATGDLWLSPQLVPTGDTTIVNWDVIDTTSCRAFGENGDEWFGGASGSHTSSAITETTLFTLECTDSLGNATSTVDTVYAVVVPTWVER